MSLVGIAPLILVVNNDFPAKDMKELIAYARANPGKISFGSSGIGAAAHLTTELLKQTADIEMVHVPYKGTAPALTALLAGDIQVLVDVPITMMPQVRAGKVRALALFSAKRIPGAAEVPTMPEAGGPAIEGSTWVMFLAPAGTPRDAVARLAAETAKVISSPEIRARFDQMGVEPVGGTPEQAARFLEDEIVKWARVITAANVKPEHTRRKNGRPASPRTRRSRARRIRIARGVRAGLSEPRHHADRAVARGRIHRHAHAQARRARLETARAGRSSSRTSPARAACWGRPAWRATRRPTATRSRSSP